MYSKENANFKEKCCDVSVEYRNNFSFIKPYAAMLVEGEKKGILQKNGYSQLVRKEHYVHVEERKSDFLQFWSFIQFLTIYMIKLRIFMLPIQS